MISCTLGDYVSADIGRSIVDGLIEIGHQIKVRTRDITRKEVVEWVRKYRRVGEGLS